MVHSGQNSAPSRGGRGMNGVTEDQIKKAMFYTPPQEDAVRCNLCNHRCHIEDEKGLS